MKIFDQNQAPYIVNINDCAYSADIRQCENTENFTKLTEPKTLCEADINSPASCEPLPSTEDGRYRSFAARTNSMTFDKVRIGYTYYSNSTRPFTVVDQDQFECRYTKSGGCYYEYRHPKINLYVRFGDKKYSGGAVELRSMGQNAGCNMPACLLL